MSELFNALVGVIAQIPEYVSGIVKAVLPFIK